MVRGTPRAYCRRWPVRAGGIRRIRYESPTATTSKFLGSAFDVDSMGMGSEIAILEYLLGQKSRVPFSTIRKFLTYGPMSNMLSSCILWQSKTVPNLAYFGEAANSFCRRVKRLESLHEEIEFIVLRSMSAGLFVENGTPFSRDDLGAFLIYVYTDERLAPLEDSGWIASATSASQLWDRLYEEGLEKHQMRNLREQHDDYLCEEKLQKRLLAFHIEKLTLMLEILEADLRISQADIDVIPSNIRDSWAPRWAVGLKRTIPTPRELIEMAKSVLARAR